MPRLRYLNSVLTVIAVLLTLNVYALWTATPAAPVGATESLAAESDAPGMPNAGKQRKDMLDELRKLNGEVAGLKAVLTSGQVKVRVEGEAKGD